MFIVTNNLDKPHGFYWQNFYKDHFFTYSQDTLKHILSLHNFEILKMCGKGHKTHQNYNYHYIQCIAEKKKC